MSAVTDGFESRSRLLTIDRPTGWIGGSVRDVHGTQRRVWRTYIDDGEQSVEIAVSYPPPSVPEDSGITIVKYQTDNGQQTPLNVVYRDTQRTTDSGLAKEAVEIMQAVQDGNLEEFAHTCRARNSD